MITKGGMGVSLKVIVGYKGAGKTNFCTHLCWEGYLQGRKIFSNYKLEFPFTPLNVIEMIDNPNMVKNGIIAIDEAHCYLDSRLSGSKKNRMFSYIMLQGRKRRIDIIITSQSIDQIDIRLRRHLEHLYECKALKKDTRDGKNILRPATSEEIENQEVDLVRIEFTDFTMGQRKKMLYDPKPMFSKYDSDEFINAFE
jgi:hypothetical protein